MENLRKGIAQSHQNILNKCFCQYISDFLVLLWFALNISEQLICLSSKFLSQKTQN